MGKGSEHWWHNEKVRRLKKHNPEKHQQYLDEERRKQEARKAEKIRKRGQREVAEAQEEQRIYNMPPEERRIVLAQNYATRLRTAIPQVRTVDIAPDLSLSDAELHEIASNSLEKYGLSMFRLFSAAEIGSSYYPGGVIIREMFGNISNELGSHVFATQIISYHISAEMQCLINNDAENDQLTINALEVLRGHTHVPLMAEIEFDAAYTLWSRVGSWLGAMSLAGLEPVPTEAERRKISDRYRATHASVELLQDKVRKRLNSRALSNLIHICRTANEAGRLLYDFEFSPDTVRIFKECGFTLHSLLRFVGLSQPTGKAPAQMKAEALAERKRAAAKSAAGEPPPEKTK